jgi:hypothetical protein
MSWGIWNCQKFIGADQTTVNSQVNPMRDSDALPK